MEICGGCGARPGTHHGDRCDHALCPACGCQRFGHDCPHGDALPAIWHGVDPRDEIARFFGWWMPLIGVDHLVEDTERVLVAAAKGLITWNSATQRFLITNQIST